MPAMTGRIVSSAVTCGLLASLWACEARGNAEAQNNLGFLYYTGQGVPQDYVEAARWYRLAADQGLAEAQYNLGLMYAEGEGVPQDDAEAARWYRLAADQGDAKAQKNLGLMYDLGQGIPQDRVAGHMWLSLAAAQTSAEDRDRYAEMRDLAAEEMTPEQVVEAQRLAREWTPTTPP